MATDFPSLPPRVGAAEALSFGEAANVSTVWEEAWSHQRLPAAGFMPAGRHHNFGNTPNPRVGFSIQTR